MNRAALLPLSRLVEIEETTAELLALVRDQLACDVDANSEWDRASAEPRIGTLAPDARAWIDPMLAAVRRAEAVVGRPDDGQPAWLNRLIDGPFGR